jgi:hypothetical protein
MREREAIASEVENLAAVRRPPWRARRASDLHSRPSLNVDDKEVVNWPGDAPLVR